MARAAFDPRKYNRKLRPTTSRVSSLMVLNQKALDEVTLSVAEGMFKAAKLIVETAGSIAPDSPLPPYPTGEGLPRQGGVLVYAGNKKTHGWSLRGDQPAKPRAVRDSTKEHSVVAVAGFGFPARFVELGTIKSSAQPFLAPSRDAVGVQGVVEVVGSVTRPRFQAP